MVKRSIRIIFLSEIFILLTYFISLEFFLNLQVAFLSSFFVILGSSYAYKKMVIRDGSAEIFEGKRDLLDTIEDPHELYEENDINNAPFEDLDLKAIVKEEKKKIKTFSIASMKKGVKGSTSAFRLLPYLFLVLGFIALANNEMLNLAIYLPSLLVGIIVGYLISKEMF
ncbi:MAG: hypothetical protein M0Q24_00325 [Sulfurimonas sp.]|uniref:hypothetical protein n=1 Tax=Sulfurimonas sp. TaxID=2022749 RepID=UPI0025E2A926|nr:hypothetical protein [Sulfurimonas sp.]MCK9490505.1 hypothetical protein [Sulfurimonas sp.]